jgi:hypothetical protein
MPHATLKIEPGVNTNETPVLNMAGIAACNLIRFKYDPHNMGLVEKLGGWSKFYSGAFSNVVRHIYAWQEIDSDKFAVVGMEGLGGVTLLPAIPKLDPVTGANTGFYVADVNNVKDLTPVFRHSNLTPQFHTTINSPLVDINDTTLVGIHTTDSVYIATHIAVGGIVLFGQYAIQKTLSFTEFLIQSSTLLGLPNPALSTATTTSGAPGLPIFTPIVSSYEVTVTLPNHGYQVGDVFPLLVPVTLASTVLQIGEHEVRAVADANNFTILADDVSSSATPVTLNGGNVRLIYNIGGVPAKIVSGYGAGGYGEGGYGTGGTTVVPTGDVVNATDRAFDNWGSVLLASPENQVVNNIPTSGIYQWTPDVGTSVLALIAQAPPCNDGFFVGMPQRQIIAWGSSFSGIPDPLLIRWCDVNDYTAWAATITNQAGSYRLPKGSKIVAGIQGPQQGIIFTDLAVWAMQYVGQPYIYSFNEIGNGCGLIGQKAATSLNGTIYWMSQRQFFQLSGGGVAPIPCPVWDVVFQNIDRRYYDKIRVAPNSMFNEIAWYYTSNSSPDGENDAYIKFNYLLNTWDYGLMARSAWINQSVVGPPLAAGRSVFDGKIRLYQHDIALDADGQPMDSWFSTGYFSMSDGDSKVFVDEIWPDFKWGPYNNPNQNAGVKLTFTAKDFPSQQPQMSNAFTFKVDSTYVTPRLRGRLMQVTIGSNDVGSFWRVGGMRYRLAPDGKY